jgi:membrane-bound serine protease (ClpP class)
MDKKGEISALKAWLMVLASLIDDAIVLVLVFLGLWYFHVKISWVVILIVAVAIIAFVFIMHKAVIPAIRRRKVTGAEGMIGATGKVTETLNPAGTIIIKGEYWKASSIRGIIDIGHDVEVVAIKGLNLEVKEKE